MGYLLDLKTQKPSTPAGRKPAPKPKPSLLQRDDHAEAQTATREKLAQQRRDDSPNPGMHPDREMGLDFKGNAPVTPLFRPKIWDEKIKPQAPIKAPDDRNGGKRVQMGELDPHAAARESQKYRADDVSTGIQVNDPNLSFGENVAQSFVDTTFGPIAGTAMQLAKDPEHFTDPDPEHLIQEAAAPTLKNLMVIRDINGRLAQGRRWAVDNPSDDTDDPVIEYTTPEGNTRTSDQLADYYDIGDGKPRTVEQMKYEPNFASASQLDVLTKVSPKQMKPGVKYVQTKDKQIWRVPNGYSGEQVIASPTTGVLYALPDKFDQDTLIFDEKGAAYLNKEMKLADGTVVPHDYMMGKTATYIGRGFDDGTMVRDAEGNPTDYGRNADSQQANTEATGLLDSIVHKTNMDVRDPRAPWQDTTGKNFWQEGYDKEKSAWKEILPFATDMTLGSLPYFVPGYGLAAGAADALPYMLGYDGDSYSPKGRGFENLDQLGEGSFAESDMTRSQQFAGVGSAIMNAALERVSGPAIGGVENLIPGAVKASKVGQAVGRIPAPIRALGSAVITEGPIEEGPNAFFDRAKTDTFPNYGKTQDWNTEQGKYVYRADESPMARFGNVMGNVGEASLGGSFLGGGLSALRMSPSLALQAGQYVTNRFGPKRPRNVAAPGTLKPGVGATLEIQRPTRVRPEEE